MNRREYLTGVTVGMAAFAGCSAVTTALESEEYEQGDGEALLPDSVGEDWPDQDFQANHGLNENFDQVWTNPDETVVVMLQVNIEDTVSEAEDVLERARQTAGDISDFTLADEAFIYDDGETADCYFRDSNAMCQVVAARQSGFQIQPDRQRATTYAELIYQDWTA